GAHRAGAAHVAPEQLGQGRHRHRLGLRLQRLDSPSRWLSPALHHVQAQSIFCAPATGILFRPRVRIGITAPRLGATKLHAPTEGASTASRLPRPLSGGPTLLLDGTARTASPLAGCSDRSGAGFPTA